MNNPKICDYLWKHFSSIGNQGHRINVLPPKGSWGASICRHPKLRTACTAFPLFGPYQPRSAPVTPWTVTSRRALRLGPGPGPGLAPMPLKTANTEALGEMIRRQCGAAGEHAPSAPPSDSKRTPLRAGSGTDTQQHAPPQRPLIFRFQAMGSTNLHLFAEETRCRIGCLF